MGGDDLKKKVIKLPSNLTRRNYTGGAGIQKFRGNEKRTWIDGNRPEEWIGSLVEAVNPGMEKIEGEGLAKVTEGSDTWYFKDVIEKNPEFYLGEIYQGDGVLDFGFLFKVLDSSMRLHVQAHPTREFAKTILGKPYGKLECYYILDVREGTKPYIRLGFQHAPSKRLWKKIIETQDMEAMDACFEKILVNVGDIWYIPGGMPHAIGEGITLLEIMEPSDLVVRCEFEREGIVVPKEARFMQKDLEFCLEVFDYKEYSKEEIQKKCKLQPRNLVDTKAYKEDELVARNITGGFHVKRYQINTFMEFENDEKPKLAIVCKGKIEIKESEEVVTVNQGESFFLAAALEKAIFLNKSEHQSEICMVCSERTDR